MLFFKALIILAISAAAAAAAIAPRAYTSGNQAGYFCATGTLGITPQVTYNACTQSIISYLNYNGGVLADNDCRSSGNRPTSDKDGKGCAVGPGKTWTLHGLQGCSYSITNTGTGTFTAHHWPIRWIAQYVLDNCPRYGSSQTNVRQGEYGSFGGYNFNSISKMKYVVSPP